MKRSLWWIPIALIGCASSSTLPERSTSPQTMRVQGASGRLRMSSESSGSSFSVSAPIEAVWKVLPMVFDSLSMPVNNADQATHTIGNNAYKVRQRLGKAPLSRYLDCGQTQIGPNADSYDVVLSVMVQLQPGAQGMTTVATTIDASAKPVAYSQAPSPCSSKGALETRISALVQGAVSK